MRVVKSVFNLLLLYLIAGSLDAIALPQSSPQSPLGPLLLGEFALQSGQLDQAAAYALQAAMRAPGDPMLAQRAMRIAFMSNNTDLSKQALALWRARAPGALAVRSAQAALALRMQDWASALRTLCYLLEDRQPESRGYALMAILDGGHDVSTLGHVLDALIRQAQIPNRYEVWQEFAQLALRLDQPILTHDVISELAKRFPYEPRVVLMQATYWQRTGHQQDAVTLLHQAEPLALHRSELSAAVALAYAGMNRVSDAQRVLIRGPTDLQSYSLRALLLVDQADRLGLRQLYKQLARHPVGQAAERCNLLARMAEYLKEYPLALHWYHQIHAGPLLAQALLRSVDILDLLGRHSQALHAAQRLEEEEQSDEVRRSAYLEEAQLVARTDDFGQELAVYARALTIFPDDVDVLYSRAMSLEKHDEIIQAEADLRRCLVRSPDHAVVLNGLGYLLADHTSRYAEALTLIERARAAEPNNPLILDSYGWVLFKMGQLTAAHEVLQHAWSLNQDPDIGVHLGEVTCKMGGYSQAQMYFNAVQRLEPSNRALPRARLACQP